MKKKMAAWTVLVLMALALSACAKGPMMVKCPDCGAVFDAHDHVVDIESGRN